MARGILILILSLSPSCLLAQNQQFKMEEVTEACSRANQKDKICGMLLQIRQIGNDAVEFAKSYLNLTPTEYAFLTAANSLATGRIRMQTSTPMFADSSVALDIQRSETQLIFSKDF